MRFPADRSVASRYAGTMMPTRGGVVQGDADAPSVAPLRREVLLPVPSYRRASSLIGLSVVLVLVASAVDAVVWTYQSQRRFWREQAAEPIRPPPARALEPRYYVVDEPVIEVEVITIDREAGPPRGVAGLDQSD
jgi:hypothetical protein